MYAARLSITEANAIAGITYGLPPITAIGGLVVNLGLKLETRVERVCPIYHDWNLHASGDSFHQIAPALSLQKARPVCGIQEEGRIDVEMTLLFDTASALDLKALWQFFTTHRVAGGYVTRCRVDSLAETDEIPDGWCAEDVAFEDGDKIGQALRTCQAWHFHAGGEWQLQEPADAFVHMVGYRGISELYEPGTVANARSDSTPFQFAEPVYRLARWMESCQKRSVTALPFWTLAKTPNLYFWSQQDVGDNTSRQF